MSDHVKHTFGYEWNAFDQVLPEYDAEAGNYFSLMDPGDFRDAVVLDAGCGMGRWAMYVTGQHIRRLYAVDFSSAIAPAAGRLEASPLAHCVQADVTALPFRSGVFDVCYSLGVLHHLVDPDAGMREVVRVTSAHGRLLLYLYYALDNRPAYFRWILACVTVMRRVISSLPKPIAHAIAVMMGLVVYWPMSRLSGVVERVASPRVASAIPLSHYARLSLKFLIADAFDRFATPVEFRYTKETIKAWLTGYGLNTTFAPRSPFWVVLARQQPQSRAQ